MGIVQIIMVELPYINIAVGCTHLNWLQWIMCFAFAFGQLVWGILLRLIRSDWIPSSRELGADGPDDIDELDAIRDAGSLIKVMGKGVGRSGASTAEPGAAAAESIGSTIEKIGSM